MLEPSHNDELPVIPGKRYFTIGEVSELCAVKPHVLRYWEQEFPQLTRKRRGNRRYYQRQDVLMIRQIRAFCTTRGSPSAARVCVCPVMKPKTTPPNTKQMIRQMIAELEDVLVVLKK
jgi:DNA-binding transcriptional MerR regulator